jgi:hypothetical protein
MYRKPGRLCWKAAISGSENKSMFLCYLQIIIHICPTLVFIFISWAVVNTKFCIQCCVYFAWDLKRENLKY